MRRWPVALVLSIALGPGAISTSAQGIWGRENYDTTYVRDYSRQLNGRIYLSTKYNGLRIGGAGGPLIYRPNNRINLGVGASYHGLTLNIGFGVPFLNDDDEVRGRTRYFDAQANFHSQRWAANLFLQIFSGYYIASHERTELGWTQETERPYREDMTQFNIGLSLLRVLNERRFSYRAAFSQDAWQRRSQGSFLLGGYLTFYGVEADSSLVPARIADGFNENARLHRGRFFDLGPMGGYACTFVLKEHWFLTGSVALGAGISVQDVGLDAAEGTARRSDVGPGWHAQFRAGAGYNSRRNYAGVVFNQENISYLLESQSRLRWTVGNVRVNFVHRFGKRVPVVDRQLRKLK